MITEKDLIEKFIEARWKKIEVTCPDNVKLLITPCGYGEISSVGDVDYFLVDGDLPWLGASNITQLVETINNHAELVIEQDNEKGDLQKFYEENIENNFSQENWNHYSDWHKDVYGYRPSRSTSPGIYIDPEHR